MSFDGGKYRLGYLWPYLCELFLSISFIISSYYVLNKPLFYLRTLTNNCSMCPIYDRRNATNSLNGLLAYEYKFRLEIAKTPLKKNFGVFVVFSIGCLVLLVPEIIAYPYPIGYDVINYYIPVISNFEQHWSIISTQFPFYSYLLHLVKTSFGLDSQATVTITAIITFGFFAVSLFYLGVRLLKLSTNYSILLAICVIFQIAVLRTAWDLHKDLFALTTMFFAFVLLVTIKKNVNWKIIILAITLCTITIISDRMVGLLLIFSLTIYSILDRNRIILLGSIAVIGFLTSIILLDQYFYNISINTVITERTPFASVSESYTPLNLFIIFIVVNGPILPLAIMGYYKVRENLLKIPLLVTATGSFSWTIFPYNEGLVADRWIILCGIFLSIFGAYAIINFIRSKISHTKVLAFSILCLYILLGLMYAVLPYDKPFILHWIARKNLENYVPLTMQYNSLDIRYNDQLLSVISWINNNTDTNSIIVGQKHLRGWMEIGLKDERAYKFVTDPEELTVQGLSRYNNSYLISYNNDYSKNDASAAIFANDVFNIFRIDRNMSSAKS